MAIALKLELVVARGDADGGSNFEDSLEADAFLADEPGRLAPAALGALADAADGLDILARETPFIAVYANSTRGVCDAQRRQVLVVLVVIGVLDQLQEKVRSGLVEVGGEAAKVSSYVTVYCPTCTHTSRAASRSATLWAISPMRPPRPFSHRI